MIVILVLVFLAALAAGAAAGCLMTIEHYERLAARQQADEEELAEVEELYAAWATLRREQPLDRAQLAAPGWRARPGS